jgi:hypothetical protein
MIYNLNLILILKTITKFIMNLNLLPEVSHREKMDVVFGELLKKETHQDCIVMSSYCDNDCGSISDSKYTKDILFNKYKFCSQWCQYDFEITIRKSWLRSRRGNLK